MKKRKKLLAAAVAFAAALNMNGCGTYGPPEDEEDYYDPDVNQNMDVYGPPADTEIIVEEDLNDE
ncbi:MAG: hypothetical protein IJ446_07190 [Oscillospiraceae bacterium]|nr:hypothetical protein [Oscillospiraceae bacterium]